MIKAALTVVDAYMAAAHPWYLLTALLMGPNGQHNAVSGLMPAASERDARMIFTEEMMNQQCPKGWGLREVSATSLPGLSITRIDEPAAVAD